ncbi:MAG: electron transfer flavoprotein subunit alpha/FixB family protein [Desulfobacterales bacterium]|nr:MAG: electron transfer flavoprotein subunit alpha/FixB family protein [Desulfobacterales bacterium]
MYKMNRSIWVFADYRNYFQNRVTLQLLAKANQLAAQIGAEVCAVVLGYKIDEYVAEYIAHGAQKVVVVEHRSLQKYSMEKYAVLMERLARDYQPEIILIGATAFGRELAPRVAKRLGTGLTADCIGLEMTEDGLLRQIAPSFGGNLVAEILTPEHRPQMATVRAGIFQEIPHNNSLHGEVVRIPLPKDLPKDRLRLIAYQRQPQRDQRLEDARVVVCGGRGMGSKKKFKKLFELAQLLAGEVGATRPVVYAGWIDNDALVGQAGRNIRPQILFSFGISGAIQHTAAVTDAEFIIAVNKNPNATMMKMADVAVVADANQLCSALIKELKDRIQT